MTDLRDFCDSDLDEAAVRLFDSLKDVVEVRKVTFPGRVCGRELCDWVDTRRDAGGGGVYMTSRICPVPVMEFF